MEYISYNVGNRDFPDVYARALGTAALGLVHIYIRQIPRAHVITIIHMHILLYIHNYVHYPIEVYRG